MMQDERHPVAVVRAYVDARYGRDEWRAWRDDTQQLSQALEALTREQALQLAREFWVQYDHKEIADLLGQLNIMSPGALAGLHGEFIDERLFWPGWLYLGAAPETTAQLLRLVDDEAFKQERNLLLLALAWIDDGLVRRAFHSWREQPPPWRADLYVGPDRYAESAGWELTPEGGRRALYRHTCYELVLVDEPEGSPSEHAVAVATPNDAVCGWCGRQLVTLLDVDLRDRRCGFVVGDGVGDGTRLRIAHCMWCSTYITLYTDVDLHGRSVWSAANEEKPRILEQVGIGEGEEMPAPAARRLALGEPRKTPFEAVGRFMLDERGISQIGGHPEWIQNTEYPSCPVCHQLMECVGQVSWEDVDTDAEGCTYAFLCLPCGKAATVYQQT